MREARPWWLAGTVEARLPDYWRVQDQEEKQARGIVPVETAQKPPKVLPPTVQELSKLPTKLKGKAKDKALTEIRKLLEAAIKGDREESVWTAMEAAGKLLGLGRPLRVAGGDAAGFWDRVRAVALRTNDTTLFWDVGARKFVVDKLLDE